MLIKDVAVTLLGLVPSSSTNRLPAEMLLPSTDLASFSEANSSSGPVLNFVQSSSPLYPPVSGSPAPQPPVPTPPVPTPPVTSPPLGEDSSSGSPSGPVSLSATAEAGRVTILDPAEGDNDSIAQIRILSQGSHGQVSVNPDNTLSLVLSEDPTATGTVGFQYEITYENGRTRQAEAQVKVTPATQKAGWGQGDFYMLEEDAQGRVVVEHGDNHRKIHVTEGSNGWTRAEIARAEGLAADKITAKWLADHPEYGATPDKALSTELGTALWYHLDDTPSSNWLLFERGYEYADTGRLVGRGASGESALHPLYIGAYGEGDAPRILDRFNIYQNDSDNVVVRDLEFHGGVQILQGSNVLMENLTVVHDGLNIQNVDGYTFRNSSILDVIKETPVNKGSTWHPSLNRDSGMFAKGIDGLLIENTFADRNGWAEGYDYNMSSKKPMPPSMYSHNYYLQNDNLDVTFRDNIVMRGASFGVQLRSGGVLEDNVFIDNNAAVNFLGGSYKNAGPIGHYTLMTDNVITSAGHKRVAAKEGALSMGVDAAGQKSALIDNIIAHLADPNNARELAQKTVAHDALKVADAVYDDTIVFNWFSSDKGNKRNPDTHVEGLSASTLNATTIQNFTADLLNRDKASIADLANHLRAQAEGHLNHVVDADLIIAFFQKGFGIEVDRHSLETTARFVPNELGDGIRWDNRLNWSTGELPGNGAATTVDLGGNSVHFGAKTVAVDDFIFGDFGRFTASSGRLDIEGAVDVATTGARLTVEGAGQVWMNGYRDSDLLKVDLSGGRFANTGDITGQIQITSTGDAQTLLAVSGGSFDLKAGSSLTIQGPGGKAGFDGASPDPAVLRMHDDAVLFFDALETGMGQLSEFRSGAFGDTSQVTSGVHLDGTLRVDLTGWKAAAKAGTTTLIDVDQLVGQFDDVIVEGLGRRQDALIRVDYVRDQVHLVLGDQGKGSGQVRVATSGDEAFTNYRDDAALDQLWDAMNALSGSRIDDPLQ